VWGINVCDDEAYFRALIHRIATQTVQRFGLDVTVDAADIGLIDGHVGLGYGIPRPEELQTLVEVARSEGIVFDPVYTGKAFHGLRRELTAGRFADAENLLFVHTGGLYGLFPHGVALPLN
jgi:D-cysteine desulfhydrase